MKQQHPTRHNAATLIELRVVITNGTPAHDTKLKFEFPPDPVGIACVWLVRLPNLKNPDAFVTQPAVNCWELRLEVVAETRPFAIFSYTPACVDQWLADVFGDQGPATTELLILASNKKFTITIHQPA